MMPIISLNNINSYVNSAVALAGNVDEHRHKYQESFGLSDIRTSYYAGLVSVVNVYVQLLNTISLYFFVFDEVYPESFLQQDKLQDSVDDIINTKLESFGKSPQRDVFYNMLKYLLIVGMGQQYIGSMVSGGTLSLFANIWSIFESSMNSLFAIKFPSKFNDRRRKSLASVCKILDINLDSLDDHKIKKLINELKDYPFTNKLGSLISSMSDDKRQYYVSEYEDIVKSIYEVRNSQHNRGVRLDGSVMTIEDPCFEIEKIKKFIESFDYIVSNIGLDINNCIHDPIVDIIQKYS